jgi:type II secretory pathway pseudopilin PulG
MRPGNAAERDDGFIMVAMLISIAIASIWMAAALPSWRHQAIREKEAELIFRGEQYARAIYLYRAKNNGASPQSLDQLVQQRYLRKKYLDPITGKDFVPISGFAAAATQFQGQGQGQGRQGGAASFVPAGITGVRSQSQDESIKIYNNQSVYAMWQFDWPEAARKAGVLPTPEGGRGGRGGREGRGGERGGARGGRGGERGGRGIQRIDELVPITPRRGGERGGGAGNRGGRGF